MNSGDETTFLRWRMRPCLRCRTALIETTSAMDMRLCMVGVDGSRGAPQPRKDETIELRRVVLVIVKRIAALGIARTRAGWLVFRCFGPWR